MFELEIDGAPAPEAPVGPPRLRTLTRLGRRHRQADGGTNTRRRVRRSVEASLERIVPDVDALAERAARHPNEIAERLEDER